MNNKAIDKFGFRGVTLLDLLNSSNPTQPHSLLAKY